MSTPHHSGLPRRDFLRTGVIALTALSIPGWAETFGGGTQEKDSPHSRSLLLRSIDAARAHGRPLLILHAPIEPMSNSASSEVWSEYIGNASTESMLDLALCDLVCAFDQDVERDLPALADVDWKHGSAVLIEPDGATPVIVPATKVKLTPFPTAAVHATEVAALCKDMHARLHPLIAPDVSALEKRARQNRAALDASAAAKLGDLDKTIPIGTEHAALVPAWVAWRAETEPLVRARLHNLLLDQVQKRILRSAPPGSAWGKGDGCGGEVLEEFGHQYAGGPCGTGFGGLASLRFLYFYSEERIEEMRRQHLAERKR